MVASAIAYLLTALFLGIGIFGLYRVGIDHPSVAGKDGVWIFTSFCFLALAWLCAHLGGI